ncbi:hypothetical protein J0S82_007400 [Galemys pyrenaicus]|uniref:Uncharacterized protein n=1 Tax=Galemys pyrenaicus TaxID=202257 RepID=A0A8J6A097_GALPY|nr:hypothetical protein J0S82_007400 [Galemys pyrenaicus]
MTPPIYARVQHRCTHLRMPTLECSQHRRCPSSVVGGWKDLSTFTLQGVIAQSPGYSLLSLQHSAFKATCDSRPCTQTNPVPTHTDWGPVDTSSTCGLSWVTFSAVGSTTSHIPFLSPKDGSSAPHLHLTSRVSPTGLVPQLPDLVYLLRSSSIFPQCPDLQPPPVLPLFRQHYMFIASHLSVPSAVFLGFRTHLHRAILLTNANCSGRKGGTGQVRDGSVQTGQGRRVLEPSNSRNRILHRQQHNKLSCQQQLKLMNSQSVKQNRAGVKRKHRNLQGLLESLSRNWKQRWRIYLSKHSWKLKKKFKVQGEAVLNIQENTQTPTVKRRMKRKGLTEQTEASTQQIKDLLRGARDIEKCQWWILSSRQEATSIPKSDQVTLKDTVVRTTGKPLALSSMGDWQRPPSSEKRHSPGDGPGVGQEVGAVPWGLQVRTEPVLLRASLPLHSVLHRFLLLPSPLSSSHPASLPPTRLHMEGLGASPLNYGQPHTWCLVSPPSGPQERGSTAYFAKASSRRRLPPHRQESTMAPCHHQF